MSSLFKVAEPAGESRANVLLVHGLGGHPYDTWRCHADETPWTEDETFWPRWLARDCQDLSVYAIGYDAPASRWLGTGMHLIHQARNILEILLAEPALARGPLIFIGHSLGGLIVKQVMRTARDDPYAADLLARIEKVAFLATPHSGAALATWAEQLRILVRPSPATSGLDHNDPYLQDLNEWYRNWSKSRGIAHLILIETKPSLLGTIVQADSADPGLDDARRVPIDSGHVNICKPVDDTKDIYVLLRKFIDSKKETLDPDRMVRTVNVGLQVVIDKVDEPVIRETLGRFRDAFRNANGQILRLKKYKGLHDSLHHLQATLGAVEDALARLKTDRTAARTLGRCAIDLRQIARRAREQLPELPNPLIEQRWIDRLENCIGDMQHASKPGSSGAELGEVDEISIKLRHLLGQAPRINQALISCAASLELSPLSESMRVIADKIHASSDSGDETALQQLEDGSAAVNQLQHRLESLIAEHAEWQWLNGELDEAMLSLKRRPQARIRMWPQVERRLAALCDKNANQDWAIELKQHMAQWIEATSSTWAENAEQDSGEDAFRVFHHACFCRFFELDSTLKGLAEQIASVAGNLNTLLTAIKLPSYTGVRHDSCPYPPRTIPVPQCTPASQ